jgi:hypothetical protein
VGSTLSDRQPDTLCQPHGVADATQPPSCGTQAAVRQSHMQSLWLKACRVITLFGGSSSLPLSFATSNCPGLS